MKKNKLPTIFLIFFIGLSVSTAWGLNAQQIYSKVKPSIFSLYGTNSQYQQPRILGSAVAVTPNILATNCHVALARQYLFMKDKSQFKTVRIVYKNRQRDMCLIMVPGHIFDPVKIRGSEKVGIGEDVIAIGNPAGIERTLSKGIISNKHHRYGSTLLQTDASVSRGSSGGGLFDNEGDLIGIITLKLRGADNIALAIPTEWIQLALKKVNTQTSNGKKNTNVTSTQKSADNQKKRVTKRIGVYGADQVILLKRGSTCIFFAHGYNKTKTLRFDALWSPRQEGFVMIFPRNIESYKVMRDSIKGGSQTFGNRKYYATRNILTFNQHIYRLRLYQQVKSKRVGMVSRTNLHLSRYLLRYNAFIMQIYAPGTFAGHINIRFNTKGLDQAIKAYEKECKNTQ